MIIKWNYELKNPKLAIKTSYELDNFIKQKQLELKEKQKELDKIKTEYEKINDLIIAWKNRKFYLDFDIDYFYASKNNNKKLINELNDKWIEFHKNRKSWITLDLNNFLQLYKKTKI